MSGRSGSPNDLRRAVTTQNQTQGGNQVANRRPNIKDLLEKMAPEFKRALPKHMDTDRLLRIAMTTIRQNPQLLAADQTSLLASLMQCAQLGLEPGLLGHAYLVPFRNTRENRTDVQFILGYRGMVELARRSDNIESIMVEAVHEHDTFEYVLGLEPKLVHQPALKDRGKPYLYYGVVKFKGGGHQMKVMTIEEIEKHRAMSKSGSKGPWVEHYDEMCKKTVFRSMFKWLPVSVEIMRQVDGSDETVKREIAEDMTEVPSIDDGTINAEFTAAPEEAPAEEGQADG